MISQNCISLDSPADWGAALRGIPHAFAHTWENCHAMHLTTGLDTYLYRFDADGVTIVCPIAERSFRGFTDIVTPFGFSGFVGTAPHPEFARCWTEFAVRKGYVCGYIGLNPVLFDDALFGPTEVHQYHSVYTLDLTRSRAQLFENVDRNRRRELANFDAFEQEVSTDRESLTAFFLDHHSAFFARHGASSVYNFSQATLALLLGLDNVLVIGALRKRIESVLVFAYTPTLAESLFNVSLPEGRRYSTQLLWYGLERLQRIGIPMLNLGGGVREGDGVAQFKERFGATKLPLRCLKQVYRPEVFAALCRSTGTDPDDRSGYFPPYRRALNLSTVSGGTIS